MANIVKVFESKPYKSNNNDQTMPSVDPADCRNIIKSDFSLFGEPIDTLHTAEKLKQRLTETFPISEDLQQTHRLKYLRLQIEDTISSEDKGRPDI